MLIAIARAERRGVLVARHVKRRHAVLHADAGGHLAQGAEGRVGIGRGGPRRGCGARAPPGVGRRVVVKIPHRGLLGVVRPLRLACDALLGRDDNHAVRRVGAVQGGRRGTAHDLDVLDLLGIEVAHAAGEGTAHAHRRRTRRALDANAVDEVDRVVRQRHRARAANADAHARAGLRGAEDGHARGAIAEQVTDAGDGERLREVGRRHLRDGVADFHTPLVTGGGRHDRAQ